MANKINFNGKEYNSVDEMPSDVRQMYKMMTGILGDQNQNGVPDILEGGALHLGSLNLIGGANMIVYNGKTYSSFDELPPEAKEKYKVAMGKLDANKDGVPDVPVGASVTNLMTNALNVVHEGKVYTNVNDLPPEARAKYEAAMKKLDANQNGVPDVIENMTPQFIASATGGRTNVGMLLVGILLALVIVAVLLAALVFRK